MKRITLVILLISLSTFGKTPKLNISLKHDSEGERKRKAQIERVAEQYDLAKNTIMRDIVIDQQALNHSSLKFLGQIKKPFWLLSIASMLMTLTGWQN